MYMYLYVYMYMYLYVYMYMYYNTCTYIFSYLNAAIKTGRDGEEHTLS